MKYHVIPTEVFKKEAKRLIQKYPSLSEELAKLGSMLSTQPEQGVRLGTDVYKIRLSIKSKGKGKRGGARVITDVVPEILKFIFWRFTTNRNMTPWIIKH